MKKFNKLAKKNYFKTKVAVKFPNFFFFFFFLPKINLALKGLIISSNNLDSCCSDKEHTYLVK